MRCLIPSISTWNFLVEKFNKLGVNFINILRVRFLYERELSSFSLIMLGFVIFGAKILYKKHVLEKLMKLTAGHRKNSAFYGFRLDI